MHTYLLVCGIILNALLILLIVYAVIEEIGIRKSNKKRAAENLRIQVQYQEELVLAKQEWQKWIKKRKELEQNHAKENDPHKRLALHSKITLHDMGGYYYFDIMKKSLSLFDLSKENNWVLEE